MLSYSTKRSIFAIFTCVSLGGLSSSCPAHAEGTNAYTGPTFSLIDSKSTIQAADEITLAKYPNSDEATVDERIETVYHADGTAECQDESYDKVLTEKGKEDNRTVDLSFMLPYSKVEVVTLEIIRPGGLIVPIDVADNSKVTISSGQMGSNIYDPNTKELQVNIPDLQVGDVIHSVVRETTLRSIIPGEFADENVFEGAGYIRHMTYEVHSPLNKPLAHMVLRNEIPGTVHYSEQKSESELVHRWEVNNVPRMFSEPSMPNEQLQRVLVSTTTDWKDVSKWYWQLSQPHLDATSPELKKAVADITAGAKTDLDKAKALFYNVSQKIRYMGITPEKDRPGFEPHDVCLTYEKQYGVCRDKAALLVAMLRTAGLNAYPVLISVDTKKDVDVPDAGFNHAIVALELEKGKYTLMDPTDQHTRDLQPWYDGDQSFLVARPEGETILTSAFSPADSNTMQIKTTGTLSTDGKIEATTVMTFAGSNDDIYRNKFSAMKQDDILRWFDERLKKAIPGAKLESAEWTPTNMLDVSNLITAKLNFTVDEMTASGNGRAIVTVPWLGDEFGVSNFVLNDTGLEKRKYPLRILLACGLDEQVSLKLADGFTGAESLPTCPQMDDGLMSYGWNFSTKDGTLNCSHVMRVKQMEYSPAEYLTLKQHLKDLDFQTRKSPVLTLNDKSAEVAKAVPASDDTGATQTNSVTLYSDKELTVTGTHQADFHIKYARKVLTYAGKIREGEVKIPYNPACEEAKVISAVVTSKTGERQVISPDEINVMDTNSSASANRYTGGKVLVLSLPGVDIGSTIEVELDIKMKNEPFIAGFDPFQLPDDLNKKSFRINSPKDLNVQTMVTGNAAAPAVDPEKTPAGDHDTYHWTITNVKAMPAEKNLPPEWIYTPGVAYYVGSYKDYLKDLNDALNAHSRANTKVQELTHTFSTKTQDKLGLVKFIRDFVAKSIREAGPSFLDLPLSELSDADQTLADGYGHGADRAILLHSMLTAAGFQPEFVLASEFPAVDGIQKVASTFPFPLSYNTPLVKVAIDGRTYYLNDTDEYAQLGTTPHDGKLAITLANQESDVVHATDDCANRDETAYKLSLASDGKLIMTINHRFFGEQFAKENKFYSEVLPEDRKRHFQEIVSQIDQGAKPVGELVNQFTSYPGTEQFTVELDNYAVMDGNYCYFNLPFSSSLFDIPGDEKRTLPLYLADKGIDCVKAEIELPPGFNTVLISPANKDVAGPGSSGKAHLLAETQPGKVVLTDSFETTPAVVEARDFPALLKLESSLEKKSANMFLLKKG